MGKRNIYLTVITLLVSLTILLFGIATLFAAAGDLKWKCKTGGSTSAPAIGPDGTVYVQSADNYLYAINSDGTLKWKNKTGNNVGVPPAAIGSDGTVYVGTARTSGDDYFYAINPDGTLKWKYNIVLGTASSLAIDSDGTIYLPAGGNLYAFNPDGTLKWKYQKGPRESSSLYVLSSSSPAIGSDGTVYVGSNDGYLYALDSGTGKGLADSPWPMFGRTADHQCRFELGGIVTAVEEENMSGQAIPGKFALSQNYPNPFNPSTTITYDLRKVSDVTLTIYSITGQKMATLVSGHQEAGHYQVSWDGRDALGQSVASGVYLYRLRVLDRGFVETRRMVLMR